MITMVQRATSSAFAFLLLAAFAGAQAPVIELDLEWKQRDAVPAKWTSTGDLIFGDAENAAVRLRVTGGPEAAGSWVTLMVRVLVDEDDPSTGRTFYADHHVGFRALKPQANPLVPLVGEGLQPGEVGVGWPANGSYTTGSIFSAGRYTHLAEQHTLEPEVRPVIWQFQPVLLVPDGAGGYGDVAQELDLAYPGFHCLIRDWWNQVLVDENPDCSELVPGRGQVVDIERLVDLTIQHQTGFEWIDPGAMDAMKKNGMRLRVQALTVRDASMDAPAEGASSGWELFPDLDAEISGDDLLEIDDIVTDLPNWGSSNYIEFTIGDIDLAPRQDSLFATSGSTFEFRVRGLRDGMSAVLRHDTGQVTVEPLVKTGPGKVGLVLDRPAGSQAHLLYLISPTAVWPAPGQPADVTETVHFHVVP